MFLGMFVNPTDYSSSLSPHSPDNGSEKNTAPSCTTLPATVYGVRDRQDPVSRFTDVFDPEAYLTRSGDAVPLQNQIHFFLLK
jgi:hypothetical protein